MLGYCCAGVLMLQGEAFAQKENVLLHPKKFYKKFFPGLKIKRNPPDSLYIKSYPNFLSVGTHVLSPSISLNVNSRTRNAAGYDASSKFKTNIGDIVGFSASYRFVSAGFALVLKSGMQTHDDYARSRYRTATIKYASSAYVLQYKYIRITGFTDVNHAMVNHRYTQRPDIVSKEFQFEGLYNFDWKRYSYIAPLSFSQRQIKSRIGFLFKTGIYYQQVAGDSAILSRQQLHFYEDMEEVNVIRSLSIKLAPGVGGTYVFLKNYYLSLVAFPSYDFYFYKYLNHPDDKVKGKQTFIFVLDAKASLGYQSKRLYAGLKYELERRGAMLQGITSSNVYRYVGVELGYRFNTPRVVRKVYKETMPPGM
jgi:hypothetical protein